MNEVCDDKHVPPKGENRQSVVGKQFGVSQKGARKWLEGEGFPSIEKMIKIAKWGDVAFEWLATGRGPKELAMDPLSPSQRRLLRAAEEYPPYAVDQAIKVMAALSVEDKGGAKKAS